VDIFLPVLLFSLSHLATGQAGASLNDQLVTAVKNGDTAAVQQLLNQGADIEAMSGDGATALTVAASSGNADLVKLLLARGANIEGADMARSPYATENMRLEVCLLGMQGLGKLVRNMFTTIEWGLIPAVG
jgi:hypothetical protein